MEMGEAAGDFEVGGVIFIGIFCRRLLSAVRMTAFGFLCGTRGMKENHAPQRRLRHKCAKGGRYRIFFWCILLLH
jgi:hypothetical protein